MKLTRGRKLLVGGGALLLVLVLAGIIIYPSAQARWNAPLAPALDLPTLTPSAISAVSQDQSLASTDLPEPTTAAQATDGPTNVPASTATHTALPSPTAEPLCGGPATMTIMGLGVDNNDNTYLYGLADVIRIVRIDFVTPKVTVLSLPRDVWVTIPGISDHNVTHGKLNQAFFYGGPGMGYFDGAGFGPGLMALTLLENFGLRVDHYGAVDMGTFVRIVDAVGGIDVNLPDFVDGRAIDENTVDLGVFYAGEQHLNGEQALRLARVRKKYNDFKRQDNQNIVLCAFKEKVLSPSVLPQAPEIISAFEDSVLTSLSPAEISQLACLGPMLTNDNIIFSRLPEGLLEAVWIDSPQIGGSTYALTGDFDEVRKVMADFQSGEWPVKSGQPSCGE
jgi:LCP family protein required for cell wall assembly